MTTEEKVTIYLQNLVAINEIEDFALVGIQGETAYARILKTYFDNAKFYYAFIKPYLNSYQYKIVENFDRFQNAVNREEELNNTLIDLEDGVKKSLMFLGESLPKNAEEMNNQFPFDKTNQTIEIWKYIIEHYPNIIHTDIVDGINFLQVPDANLTPEELAKKQEILKWVWKLNARYRIEKEVGDTHDLVADLSKRIALLERMLLRTFLSEVGEYPIDTDTKVRYSGYALPLIQAADAGYEIDRIDLEDEYEMMVTLESRRQAIMNIVKEELIEKINNL